MREERQALAINDKLMQIAMILAAISLFVAPFRSSAGWRAVLLFVAAVTIAIAARKSGRWRELIPPMPLLRVTGLAWLVLVGLWAILGETPIASLGTMRAGLITPLIAFGVFYALSGSLDRVALFIAVLVAGLIPLTVMVVLDPFQPTNPAHMPLYGSVGLLSTWFITVAPLLALAWWIARQRGGVWWPIICVLLVLCLVCGAWFTGNRTIWLCYAAMLFLGGVLAFFHEGGRQRRAALWALAGGVTVLALFAASAQFRANVHHAEGEDALQFMLKDQRAEIWRVAVGMIAERPFTGHGTGEQLGDKFSARFADPGHRSVFRHAHNTVLNYSLQMGVAGGVIIVALFASLALAFASLLHRPGVARLAGICGLALVTGFFLRNMVDDFFSRHTLLLFAALCGMLLGLGAKASAR